jgi:sugar-phosphatase
VALLAPTADREREAQMHEAAELADTEGIIALPGAQRLLDYGTPVAIVTSCSSALAAVRLSAAGLRRLNTVIGSDIVRRGKPDPEDFLLAARRLHVEPRRSLAFEDSPSGIAAARSAGTRVIALRTTHSDELLSRAHLIIDNLASLFE